MGERPPRRFFDRVVVALDVASLRSPALEIAAGFAASSGSELVGLFVEDVNLLHLSGLSVSRQVSLRTMRAQSIDAQEMDRQLRRSARDAEARLAALAKRLQLRWRFNVVRGEWSREVAAASQASDLLVMSEDAEVADLRRRAVGLSRVSRDIANVASVFVGRRARLGPGGVLALIEAAGCNEAVIERATSLALAQAVPLVVYVVAGSQEEIASIRRQCARALAGEQQLNVIRWSDFDMPNLCEQINAVRPRLVVLCSDSDDQRVEARVARFAAQLDAPVVLLRRDPS